MKKTIYLILGPTACGKTTLETELTRKLGFVPVRSFTDRTPRPDELNGHSGHIFLTAKEFDAIKKEDIAAYTKIGSNRYCTTWDVLDQADTYVIDPIGVDDLRSKAGGRYDLVEIYVTAPSEVAKGRYEARGGKEDYQTRHEAEKAQFEAYEAAHRADLVVENIDLGQTVETVVDFIRRRQAGKGAS